LGQSNDVSAVEKEVTTANQWNDVEKHPNTWIAIKNCTGASNILNQQNCKFDLC